MNDIIFRGKGKRIDNRQMIEGILLNLQESTYIVPPNLTCMYDPYDEVINGLPVVEVDLNTVGRFSGLTDKNGVKIFEGDIVHVKARSCSFTGCVIYWLEEARYVCKAKSGMRYAICNKFEFEVVGNIYDNPELLEVNNNE